LACCLMDSWDIDMVGVQYPFPFAYLNGITLITWYTSWAGRQQRSSRWRKRWTFFVFANNNNLQQVYYMRCNPIFLLDFVDVPEFSLTPLPVCHQWHWSLCLYQYNDPTASREHRECTPHVMTVLLYTQIALCCGPLSYLFTTLL
jgi:hypothetical protein